MQEAICRPMIEKQLMLRGLRYLKETAVFGERLLRKQLLYQLENSAHPVSALLPMAGPLREPPLGRKVPLIGHFRVESSVLCLMTPSHLYPVRFPLLQVVWEKQWDSWFVLNYKVCKQGWGPAEMAPFSASCVLVSKIKMYYCFSHCLQTMSSLKSILKNGSSILVTHDFEGNSQVQGLEEKVLGVPVPQTVSDLTTVSAVLEAWLKLYIKPAISAMMRQLALPPLDQKGGVHLAAVQSLGHL